MKNLREFLLEFLEENEVDLMYSSYDVIGDIAIIKIPKNLLHKKDDISWAFHLFLPKIRTVAMICGSTAETYRTRKLEILYGEDNFETIYKEHSCLFKLDCEKVFFSPRLSYERLRIANMVKAGETIINMFSGIGTFSIVIAKNHPQVKIYSIDINPDAYRYMVENVRLNRLEEKVIPILGDARVVILKTGFSEGIDRIIMPLPDFAHKFLDVAISTLKIGGVLHYYDVSHGPHLGAIEKIKKEANKQKRSVTVIGSRNLRSVGPKKYHIAIDARIFGSVPIYDSLL